MVIDAKQYTLNDRIKDALADIAAGKGVSDVAYISDMTEFKSQLTQAQRENTLMREALQAIQDRIFQGIDGDVITDMIKIASDALDELNEEQIIK